MFVVMFTKASMKLFEVKIIELTSLNANLHTFTP